MRFRFMFYLWFVRCRLSSGDFSGMKASAAEGETPPSYFERFTKEEKVFYLNVGVFAAIGLYGFFEWDYGANSPQTGNEGWFGRSTKHGGADKLGHAWSAHSLEPPLFSRVQSIGDTSTTGPTPMAPSRPWGHRPSWSLPIPSATSGFLMRIWSWILPARPRGTSGGSTRRSRARWISGWSTPRAANSTISIPSRTMKTSAISWPSSPKASSV